jgi:tetratricopeptide (TPR) repeat protein
MPSPALPVALAHHQNGELEQAARLYRDILSSEPDHPDALHLLGVVALQRGQPRKAIELIERAIAIQPSAAAFHGNLGEAYRACGQLQRAEACCRLALRLQPVFPEAAYTLGSTLMQQKRIAEAASFFRQAIQHQPNFPTAHNNLGNACRLLGDLEGAVNHFRRAVELDPQLAFAHSNLGQLLLELDRPHEALHHCREATRLQPHSAPARNNLGNVLRCLGQLNEAKACYAEALRLDPNLGMAHRNIGQALQDEGKFDEALLWYRQALELEPTCAAFHVSLAGGLAEKHQFAEAETHLRTALQYDPASLEARLGMGRLHFEQGRLAEAETEYRTILRTIPHHPTANCFLATVLLELNRQKEALDSYRTALRGNPRHAPALSQLATHLRDRMPAEEQEALHGLLADPQLSDLERTPLLFGLAHLCDAKGEHERAAEQLVQANALERAIRDRSGHGYNPEAHVGFVSQLLDTFVPEFFARVRGFGVDSERPVFIVGLPRSGTTLVEQVLASHSQVFGAGEQKFARLGFEALGGGGDGASEARAFEALKVIDADQVRQLASRHLENLNALNTSAARVTDKMPDNYLYLGFLTLFFPRARFLHCRRDPRDIAVSCWITQFRQIPWANDFEHLASRFAQYRRVMEHWRRVLPVPVLDVDYEDMVNDLEGTARRAIAFCGLEWEPACLEFHRSQRPVRTASVTQVRQPIYRRSVARWKHYDKALRPLFARLEELFALSDDPSSTG